MENQRRVEPQEYSDFFSDHVATRPLPESVVQADASAISFRAPLKSIVNPTESDSPVVTDHRIAGDETEVPEDVIKRFGANQLLAHGQERFNIFCAPCHDRTGSGNGMVPRRGFWYPPSYHTDRLRRQPLGYIFAVATQGRGKMPAYGDFLSVDDRWAIAAYIRALQLSQYTSIDQLSEKDRHQLSLESSTLKANTSQNP